MLSDKIIESCNKNGCIVRNKALEKFFKCVIPTKNISGGNGNFTVSWSIVASIPQEILYFCEKNGLEVTTSRMNEDIFFTKKSHSQ